MPPPDAELLALELAHAEQLLALERVYAKRYRELERRLSDYLQHEVALLRARIDAAIAADRRGDAAALRAIERLGR